MSTGVGACARGIAARCFPLTPARATAAAWVRPAAGAKIAAIGVVLAVYGLSIGTTWYPSPDSALYLMLGENFLDGQGYSLWGHPHLHVPPGFPLLLAGLMAWGLDALWQLNAAMVLISLAGLWFCWRAIRLQAGNRAALLVMLVVATSFTMHLASIRILSDTPFLLFAWAGLWCYWRWLRAGSGWLELGSLALVASCAIRVAGVPLAVAATAGLVLEVRHRPTRARAWINAALVLGSIGGLAIVGYAYCSQLRSGSGLPSYGPWLSALTARSWMETFTAAGVHFYESGEQLARLFTGQPLAPWAALVVLWVPTLVGAATFLRRGHVLGPMVATGYVAAMLLIGSPLARYLLVIAPLLVLYLLTGVGRLAAWSGTARPARRRLVAGLAAVLIAINGAKVLRSVYWQRWPEHSRAYQARVLAEEAARVLKDNGQPGDLFVSDWDQNRLAWLSGLPSLPGAENQLKAPARSAWRLRRWQRKGVTFVVVQRYKSPGRCQEMCRVLGAMPAYREVFSNEAYVIYSQRPIDHLPPAGHSSGPEIAEEQKRPSVADEKQASTVAGERRAQSEKGGKSAQSVPLFSHSGSDTRALAGRIGRQPVGQQKELR